MLGITALQKFGFTTLLTDTDLPADAVADIKQTFAGADKKIDEFRKQLSAYMGKNSTGNKGYDSYIAINSEYLALVAHKPLHPAEVRRIENNPPKDTEHRKYCVWKARHIKDKDSLCRFCNCLQWPEEKGRTSG